MLYIEGFRVDLNMPATRFSARDRRLSESRTHGRFQRTFLQEMAVKYGSR